MQLYGEEKVSLIAKILKRSVMDTFSKWLDLQLEQQPKLLNSCIAAKEQDKSSKRLNWTKSEDQTILSGVQEGLTWKEISFELEGRTAKQIRDRYTVDLNPALIKKNWTSEEDELILSLHDKVGTRWAYIATHLPGRSD